MNLNEGKNLIKQKKFSEALVVFLNLKKQKNFDYKIYFYLGLANFELNNFNNSINYYEKFLKEEPHSISTLINLAIVKQTIGDLNSAKKIYKKIIQINKFNLRAYYGLYLLDEKSFSDNIKLYIDYLQNFTKSFEDYDINLPSLDFRDRGYLVRAYNKGEGYFNWHNDFSFYKDSGFRLLTLIWYLNNVEEGGQTEFIDGTIIKPKRGSVLIFPTSWYLAHRGKMPLSNKKYIVTGWLHGQKTTSS